MSQLPHCPRRKMKSVVLKILGGIAVLVLGSLVSDFGIDILAILALPALFLSGLENPA